MALEDAFFDIYNSPSRTNGKQAREYSEQFGNAIHNTFRNLLSVPLTIVGVIPGVPPIPYGPVVDIPDYSNAYNLSILKSKLYLIIDLFRHNYKTASPWKAALLEANVVIDAVVAYFSNTNSTGGFNLTLVNSNHVGTILGVLPPSLPTLLANQLLNTVYLWNPNNRVRAKNMAIVVDDHVTTWINGVTFSGAVTAVGGTPLVATASGSYLILG